MNRNNLAFIESLLEMPIPPIFVIEEEVGTYELIDGLQCVSSYIHFHMNIQTTKERMKIVNATFNLIVAIYARPKCLKYKDLPTTFTNTS